MSEVNQVDISFVVDTTASMGTFVNEAKKHMTNILKEMTKAVDIDIRVGVVEYRDHPPEENSFVTKVHRFTPNLDNANKTISKLEIRGGGDGPEAVLDGIIDAVKKLKWRKHSLRLMVLIGDAPPHGYGHGSCNPEWNKRYPTGETVESAAAACEEKCIKLYSIGLINNLKSTFGEMAELTGGSFSTSHSAINEIKDILQKEFENVELDRKVFSAWKENSDLILDDLASELEVSLMQIVESYERLSSREIINEQATVAVA